MLGDIDILAPKIASADQIVFNIPAGGLENNHLTALEYRYIASQPALMQRTVFVTGETF